MTLSDDAERKSESPRAIVWDEITVTVNLGDMNFIKFTHGQQRTCRNNARAVARTEREINDFVREIVAARSTEYRELIEEISETK